MSKMYTFDDKLLVGGPEIRIGDKVFPIDDRKKTVKKLLKEINKSKKTDDDVIDSDELIIKAAFGKKAVEVLNIDMSFKAQQKLAQDVLMIMTGEDPETEGDTDGRFPETEEDKE